MTLGASRDLREDLKRVPETSSFVTGLNIQVGDSTLEGIAIHNGLNGDKENQVTACRTVKCDGCSKEYVCPIPRLRF